MASSQHPFRHQYLHAAGRVGRKCDQVIDAKGIPNGLVEIDVLRSVQVDALDRLEIVDNFVVKNNGVGFTSSNRRAFETFYAEQKIAGAEKQGQPCRARVGSDGQPMRFATLCVRSVANSAAARSKGESIHRVLRW